jgi:hypothetical protein
MFFMDPSLISKEERGLVMNPCIYAYGFWGRNEEKMNKDKTIYLLFDLFGDARTIVVVVRSSFSFFRLRLLDSLEIVQP